jgi:hypothetical protein
METMFLVAGLAVAGVIGILAAFYFSKRGGKRLRPAGAGRIGAGRAAANRPGAIRRPASRIGGAPRTGQTEFALRASGPVRTAGGGRLSGAPVSALTESWPSTPSDLEEPQPGDAWPGDLAATDPGLRAARPGAGAVQPGADASKDARQRRRVGFRKGADIDEEMWPAESFGGVSDEQFWDDMASDKPLTRTARTAQQEAGPKNRLVDTGTATNPQGNRALGGDRNGGDRNGGDRNGSDRNGSDRNGSDRGRASRGAGAGRRAAGSGPYPGPRTGPDPAAERTAIQPAYAATQPVKSMTAPVPGAPPPFQNAPQPAKNTMPPPGAAKPGRAAAGTGPVGAVGPAGPVGQPRGASAPPAETGRRRRPNNAEEDPLTSTAFSLRQRGPVDGRSSFRSRDQQEAPRGQNARGQNDSAGGPGRGPASPYGHTAPYPPAGTSYDDASSATQMMSTPPYGENYGSGSEGQADHPRRQNGTRSHARPGSPDERARPSRPAYPQDTRPASGSYPAGGAYQENGYRDPGHQPGGHQGNGNGSRGNGHRGPYDPRDDYRRLTHQRLPSRLGSCPRETLSGTPPGACTRDWRGGR